MRSALAVRGVLAAGAAFGVALASPPVGAEELRYDPAIDGAVIGVGSAAWISAELLKRELTASSCRWCGADGFDTSVRDSLRWSSPGAADTASNVLGFVVLPALSLGADALAAVHDDRARGIGVDALIIVEAGVLSADLNQLTKFVAGRQRPCAHFPDAAHPCTGSGADDNVSFYSGHTSVTMALAVASGTVAQMRGYRWAPLLWATLPALSLVTGYLRVAADEHWATDILAGAILGAGVGFAAPYLLHRPESSAGGRGSSATLSIAPLGVQGVF